MDQSIIHMKYRYYGDHVHQSEFIICRISPETKLYEYLYEDNWSGYVLHRGSLRDACMLMREKYMPNSDFKCRIAIIENDNPHHPFELDDAVLIDLTDDDAWTQLILTYS